LGIIVVGFDLVFSALIGSGIPQSCFAFSMASCLLHFLFLNKCYLVASCTAAEAMEYICFGVNPAAWFAVFMEGAFYMVVPIGFQVVMLKYCNYA